MTGYFCFDLWLRVFSLSGLMAVASYENLNFLKVGNFDRSLDHLNLNYLLAEFALKSHAYEFSLMKSK